MFCPKCGREGKGLCLECYLEGNPIQLGKTELLLCNCGSVCFQGKWGASLQEVIPLIVERNLYIPEEVEVESLDLESESGDKSINLEVTVKGRYRNESFRRIVSGSMGLKKGSCPVCGKKTSGYYEAILQFRTKKPMDLIDGEVDSLQVSKVEKVKGGLDVYVTSNSYARQVMRILKKKGFLVKESRKLIGKRKGRNVYRVSVSIKDS